MVIANDSTVGDSHYNEKDFPKALFYFQRALVTQPHDTKLLGKILDCFWQLGDYGNAIKVIERMLRVAPSNDGLYFYLGIAHRQLGNIDLATKAFERAIELNSHNVNYYLRAADVYEKLNNHEKALEVIYRGLEYIADNGPLHILAAKSEKQTGQTNKALNRLTALKKHLPELSPNWRIQYHFELGYIYDKTGSPDVAFHHFAEANNLVRRLPSFQKVDINHSLNLIRDLTALDFRKINKIIQLSGNNPPEVQPVFFVGFPRSGTTLLEKVLDSHPGVQVIEENNPLGRITSLIENDPVKFLKGDFLLHEENINELRKIYFAGAKQHVSIDDGALIVDKLPMNIVQVHVIKILFPGAKIILGLRHPCDSILSCFMQNFGVNRAMANMFKFDSIVNYYDKTMSLWKIFRENIEFECVAVRYEDLIEDMEKEIRELLDQLGLPWDDEVLNYRKNLFKRGLINTPSYSQVVKPIYKQARYRWHRYAEHFEPYFEKLAPHCEMFGYSLEFK